MNNYSLEFYDSVSLRAEATAGIVGQVVSNFFVPESLVDIGSGLGIWSKVFLDVFPNMNSATAIDLDRHESGILDELELNPNFSFVQKDLESLEGLPGDCYDLAICVEVLEHVTHDAAQKIFDEFSSKCSFVVFGAAMKGQGGTHHINERSFEFWTNEMLRRGMVPLDVMRPQLNIKKEVPGYYKYNIILWWNPGLRRTLELRPNFSRLFSAFPPIILDTRPVLTRIRYRILSVFSPKVVTWLAGMAGQIRKATALPPKTSKN
jgi:hypothetical protein